MKQRVWSLSLVVAFAWAGFSAQASDEAVVMLGKDEDLAVMACPPTWPGKSNGGGLLDRTHIFWKYGIMLFPAPEFPRFGKTGPGEIQMDCIYDGGNHLTLEVLGRPLLCQNPWPPDPDRKRWPLVCVTAVREEGTPQVNPYPIMAEPLTLETTIQGFGLRWPLERIVETARAGGYATEMEEKEIGGRGVTGRVRATKSGAQVDILFSETTGLSREIVWPGPKGPVERRLVFAKDMALRFGLTAEYSSSLYPGASTDRRKGFNNLVILDVVQRRGPGKDDWQDTIHLIDAGTGTSTSP